MKRRAKLRSVAHAVTGGKALQAAAAGEDVEETLSRAPGSSVRAGAASTREQVLDRARVVAKDGPLADAEAAAAFDVDDAAGGERLRAALHRLASRAARPGWRRRREASSMIAVRAISSSRRVIDGRMAAATTAVGSTL